MARCAVCDTADCFHVDRSVLPAVKEVVTPAPEKAEQETRVYVPGVRSTTPTVNGGAESRGPSVVYGSRGEKGDRGGIGPQGAPGPPGRDANIKEAIDAATLAMTVELDRMRAGIEAGIVVELKKAGLIDANGKAILLEGKPGRDGREGMQGPVGARGGVGERGPAGNDGVDGKNGIDGKPGRDADLTEVREFVRKEMLSLKDSIRDTIVALMKERGILDENGRAIPGPTGAEGAPGPQGKPGNIAAAVDNAEKAARKLIAEELAALRTEIAELRSKLEGH